jgi:hypothetical protein
MAATTMEPSDSVLADAPGRVLKFLSGAGRSKRIRAILAARGFGSEDIAEGWSYLHEYSGYQKDDIDVLDTDVDSAIRELDQWDEPNFEIIRVTLERRFPEQAAYVFNNLRASTGAGAVLSVSILLDRLDDLESSPAREPTRKTDHAALEVLEKKGYGREERKRLRGLGKKASSPKAVAPAPEVADDGKATLLKLHGWWAEHGTTARVAITRRDDLITLGLAKRRTPRGDEVEEIEPIAAPAPAPAPSTDA